MISIDQNSINGGIHDERKIKKRVTLYYPLGNKKTEWTDGGGAQRRLSFFCSHMNQEKIVPTLVYWVYAIK